MRGFKWTSNIMPTRGIDMGKPLLTEETIQEETKLQDTLRNIKHVIIVMSGKGAVGKSTVSSNLAAALSMK